MKSYITLDDIEKLCHAFVRGTAYSILSRLRLAPKATTRARWDRQYEQTSGWSSIGRILANNNLIATGDPHKEYDEYIANKYLVHHKHLVGLSVGCGRGSQEMRWAQLCHFDTLLGVDISPVSIDDASREARHKNLSCLHFECLDVTKMELPKDHFDVVFAHAALHHFRPIEAVVANIHGCLKSGGIFVIDDYVGPSRFQWTDAQLREINALLSEIPTNYRQLTPSHIVKIKVHRPGILRMLLVDPSEAADSEKIMPAVRQMFKPVEVALRGGTILNPLFHAIGRNFQNDDSIAAAIVDRCIAKERSLIEAGTLPSDFIQGVFRKDG
jgi:SAM-dependent methyltransferase